MIKIAFEIGSIGPIVHKQSLQNVYCYHVSIFGGSTDCDLAYVAVGNYDGEVCCVLMCHVSCGYQVKALNIPLIGGGNFMRVVLDRSRRLLSTVSDK